MLKNTLSVNIGNYIDLRSSLPKRKSETHLRPMINKNKSQSRLSCNFQIPGTAKASQLRPRTPSQRHISLGKLSNTSKAKLIEGNQEVKKRKQTPKTLQFGKSNAKYSSRGSSKNKGMLDLTMNNTNKKQHKKLSLGQAHIMMKQNNSKFMNTPLEEMQIWRSKYGQESQKNFDRALSKLIEKFKFQPDQQIVQALNCIKNRFDFERQFHKEKIQNLSQSNLKLNNEISLLKSRNAEIRTELESLSKRLQRIDKQRTIQNLKLNFCSVATNTDSQLQADQYKVMIIDLDSRLQFTLKKLSLCEKVLRVVRSRYEIDLDFIYEQIISAQNSEHSETNKPVFRRKKIEVDVRNTSQGQADVSIINDSEESSFNFAEKLAEADMQAFYQPKREIHQGKQLAQKFKEKLHLNLEKLGANSDLQEGDEQVI